MIFCVHAMVEVGARQASRDVYQSMRFVGEVFLVAKIFVLINLAFSLGFWINH
jgi:hypothetical protein